LPCAYADAFIWWTTPQARPLRLEAIRHAATIQVATRGNRADFEALVRVIEQQRIRLSG